MPTTRKSYPPSLKAKVSVEAIKAQKTITELAQLYHVNPNLIAKWKKQAVAVFRRFSGSHITGTVQRPRPRKTNCSNRSAGSKSNWSGSKKDLGLSIEEKRRCIAPHRHLTFARQMRVARVAAVHVLPSARRREQRESAPDAATGRTIPGGALLRKPQVRCSAGARAATTHQPKTRATTNAVDGHRSLVPEAEPESSGTGTRDLSVSAPRGRRQSANQVWSTDITYIPMRSGFLYLVAIMDWFSRLVLSWDLSNTMGVDFCRSALEEALRAGRCEIFNSDQGSQFTASQFLQPLKDQSIRISMDGRGRAMDNVFIERLWRSVKYELIYPGEFDSGAELWSALSRYFDHYNFRRPHQALGCRTPADLYWNRRPHNKMR